jgi:hypothetical protein
MAHPEQRVFFGQVASRFPESFTGRRVLEVGSLNINGTVRDFFTDCDYTGVDVGEGPGVDVVAEGQTLDYDDESFDTVISAECFEHNPYWLETFVNMRRMCSGLVVFTCATEGRAEHGTTRTDPGSSPLTAHRWEYYRNLTADDFRDALDLDALFSDYRFSTNDSSHDLYFWGLVPEETP